MQRSDKYTQSQKIPVLFSDFPDSFKAHPITGDIARVTNEQAIKQSLRNLVMTAYGERFFQPSIGSNVQKSLFEMNDDIAASDIKYYIKTTIDQNEKRVNLVDVQVYQQPDIDKLTINIVFVIINTNTQETLTVLLKRIR